MKSGTAESNPPGELYCTQCEKTFSIGENCPEDGTKLLKLAVRIDPFLGRDLEGRYTILEKLGQGGMGAVYRAEQHSVQREVAVKVVNPQLTHDFEVIKRFGREAKLASKLSHPNAVAVLEFGQTDDGVFFLVMELVAGRTLDQIVKEEKFFRPERVARIGAQVCDALERAHALSIVHRDLKPANIMLMNNARDFVKVLDFGLAKIVGNEQSQTTMTNAGAVIGTPAFIPPEIALGEPADARSDLYSLGVVLYLLACGHLPFESDSPHELLALHASTDEAPIIREIPPALAAVIGKMIRKRPSERYQTATQAREALESAVTLTTPLPGALERLVVPEPGASAVAAAAPALSSPSFPTAPRSRRRGLAVVVVLLVAAAAAAGVFVVVNQQSANEPPSGDASGSPAEPKIATPAPPPPTTTPPPDAAELAVTIDAATVVEPEAVASGSAETKPAGGGGGGGGKKGRSNTKTVKKTTGAKPTPPTPPPTPPTPPPTPPAGSAKPKLPF